MMGRGRRHWYMYSERLQRIAAPLEEHITVFNATGIVHSHPRLASQDFSCLKCYSRENTEVEMKSEEENEFTRSRLFRDLLRAQQGPQGLALVILRRPLSASYNPSIHHQQASLPQTP